MKINNSFKAIVIGATKNEYDKNGEHKCFYNISIADSEGDISQIPTNEDTFTKIRNEKFVKYQEHELNGAYDTKWNRYTVENVK